MKVKHFGMDRLAFMNGEVHKLGETEGIELARHTGKKGTYVIVRFGLSYEMMFIRKTAGGSLSTLSHKGCSPKMSAEGMIDILVWFAAVVDSTSYGTDRVENAASSSTESAQQWWLANPKKNEAHFLSDEEIQGTADPLRIEKFFEHYGVRFTEAEEPGTNTRKRKRKGEKKKKKNVDTAPRIADLPYRLRDLFADRIASRRTAAEPVTPLLPKHTEAAHGDARKRQKTAAKKKSSSTTPTKEWVFRASLHPRYRRFVKGLERLFSSLAETWHHIIHTVLRLQYVMTEAMQGRILSDRDIEDCPVAELMDAHVERLTQGLLKANEHFLRPRTDMRETANKRKANKDFYKKDKVLLEKELKIICKHEDLLMSAKPYVLAKFLRKSRM